MLILVPASDCIQAREAASARLDGELSELETARLEAHLRGCADCREYVDEVETITLGLRSAPLEGAGLRVELPRRRRIPVPAAAAAAAVVAVLAASPFALGHRAGPQRTPGPAATGAAYEFGVHGDATEQNLLEQLRAARPVPADGHGRVRMV
jgi:predicted anti-sigma-YlaC factor YlaD